MLQKNIADDDSSDEGDADGKDKKKGWKKENKIKDDLNRNWTNKANQMENQSEKKEKKKLWKWKRTTKLILRKIRLIWRQELNESKNRER